MAPDPEERGITARIPGLASETLPEAVGAQGGMCQHTLRRFRVWSRTMVDKRSNQRMDTEPSEGIPLREWVSSHTGPQLFCDEVTPVTTNSLLLLGKLHS